MMIPNEQKELLLDQVTLEPGLDVTQLFKSMEFSKTAVRNEFKTLQQLNNQLREQVASLQSRNKELEAYAHTVAHALKNPLAVMIVTSGAIREITDLTPQELREYMQEIKSTAYEMNKIIDDLMRLSEMGQADQSGEPIDMARVVAKTRQRLRNMAREYKGHVISPKTWPVAIGYAPWIEEVWANYISNALKYGGRSPRVELGASIQPDGMIRFWARDNGPGIPKNKQARLFTPFTRLGEVKRPGNGLGLSIVRRIIEKSGGQAGVEGEAGQGSLFFFTLPAVQARKEPAAERKSFANRTSGRLVQEYPQSLHQSPRQSS